MSDIHRFSTSLITQGSHRFYTCTMPSEVLAKCCFVTTRDEDPSEGFQRTLDEKRAREIAKYIDTGLGTIPCSIILSAQGAADFKVVDKGKTVEFKDDPHSFLVLDGQHRVYGFSLAETNLRVPVVIYSGLSRRDESRLFIDINSKQKGVSNELLLDIKKLAEYEDDTEQMMRKLFDRFYEDRTSQLYGLLSPAKKSKMKISRVTFNLGVKPITFMFKGVEVEYVYNVLNAYFLSFREGLSKMQCEETFTNSVVFRAIMAVFPVIASKVKDRFGSDYTPDNFFEVMEPMFNKASSSKFVNARNSHKGLASHIEDCMKVSFSL